MPYKVKRSGKCGAAKPYAVVKETDGKVMGCHATEQSAQNQLAALYANESEAAMSEETMKPSKEWEGILAVEGVTTGDGREFAPGSLTWAQPPLPLAWQQKTADGHSGSVNVARIDEVWRDETNPAIIRGRGVFDTGNDDSKEAHRQVNEQFLRGVSIDVDDVNESDIEFVFPEKSTPNGEELPKDMMAMFGMPPEKTIFHAGRIRGATLVNLPAFVEAQVWLASNVPNAVPVNVTKSDDVSGVGETQGEPVMVSSAHWNGSSEERKLAPRITMTVAREAFGHVVGTSHSGTIHRNECLFLHHEIKDDGIPGPANVNACVAAIGILLSEPNLTMSLGERHTTYAHLAKHVRDAGLIPQPFTDAAIDDVNVVTACACENDDPPREWFTDPKLDGPTAMTITADGRIFGHAALFGTCHTGVQDSCVQPPREDRHDYFMLGEVITAGGDDHVPVGTITLGTGHAPTYGISPQQAVEHYDNTGTAVADVAVGNDRFGIWFSGSVRNLPPGRIAELRVSKLSGDWRRIGGKLRLVALLAVNVPGFPVPRMSTSMSSGRQMSLVASGIFSDVGLHNDTDVMSDEFTKLRAIVKRNFAAKIGRDLKSRKAALRSLIH